MMNKARLIYAFTIIFTLSNVYPTFADEWDAYVQAIDIKMNKHLEYFKNRDYAKTYQDFCSGLKENVSLEDYSKSMDLLLDKMGNLKNYTIRDRYFITSYKTRQTTSINVIYDADFMNGKGEINTTFIIDKNGGLKLSDFSIYSPLIYDILQEMPEEERKQFIR